MKNKDHENRKGVENRLWPPQTVGWAGTKPIYQLAGLPLDKNQKFTHKIEVNYIQHENEHWYRWQSFIYIQP